LLCIFYVKLHQDWEIIFLYIRIDIILGNDKVNMSDWTNRIVLSDLHCCFSIPVESKVPSLWIYMFEKVAVT